jgi:hypothetical protein
MNPLTPEYTQEILSKINALPADTVTDQIKETAAELELMNYRPLLLNDVPDFLHLTKSGLIQFIKKITDNPPRPLTEQHLSLLLYHYDLLQRLRRNEPEAWDEVNELMEDD